MAVPSPLLPGRPPVSGYGRGSFRLGSIEHKGSLLILPGGVYAWPAGDAGHLSVEDLSPVLDAGAAINFLILGTGPAQIFPSRALREHFAAAHIGLEAMDTGAACRTHNVLLAEERIFASALIAIP